MLKPLRFVLRLLLMIAVALAIGFGLSIYLLTDGRSLTALKIGPWSAWPDSGSSSPDPYTRAVLARTGPLQLGQSEGLEFIATTDNEGRPLERTCNYRIEGRTPTATFWTLRATDAQWTNIARSGTPEAFHSARISRVADGTTRLNVGPLLAPYNWLEIEGAGPFQLVLELYDTAVLTGFGSSDANLPDITLEAC